MICAISNSTQTLVSERNTIATSRRRVNMTGTNNSASIAYVIASTRPNGHDLGTLPASHEPIAAPIAAIPSA